MPKSWRILTGTTKGATSSAPLSKQPTMEIELKENDSILSTTHCCLVGLLTYRG